MTLQSALVKFTILLSMLKGHSCHDFELVVDITRVIGELQNIWDSTGFSPPGPGEEAVKYLTSRELFLNLAYIGSLPFTAIRHVRVHWLLELIKAKSVGEQGQVEYDYNQLDELISWLDMFGLRPSFELMGNPGGVFTDFETDQSKDYMWQTFITDLVSHYKDKFGILEVKQWRFELWNEPDSKQYNSLNLSTNVSCTGYLRYARASMEGLRVHGMKVSGPAGTFRDLSHHNKSWGLLELCSRSLAQNNSCDIETITFHKKGDGDAGRVVSNTKEFYKTATTQYPLLKSMKFANNEADILSGWWREERWRGDVNYAADVCQVIASFLEEIKKNGLPLSYISNDNGFINQPPSYFNQRTLLTRFEINETLDRHIQWIRKPVMIATAFLGYLGPNQIQTFFRQKHTSSADKLRLSVIASSDQVEVSPGWSGAILVSVSSTSDNCSDTTLNFRLKLPSDTEIKVVIFRIDNKVTNPRYVWEQYGKPTSPNHEVLDAMRKNEGPYLLDSFSVKEEWTTHTLQNRCPSVTLVHLCRKPLQLPAKVFGLRAYNITYNEVLLLWENANTRCVSSYEVYFCHGKCLKGHYAMIHRNIMMLSFQFRSNQVSTDREGTRGKYKVRVRDYWNRLGEFSEVISYPTI